MFAQLSKRNFMIQIIEDNEDTGLRFHFFPSFVSRELFIGSPWLERETRSRESPVRVPTGTTAGPRDDRDRD
jgi:hypothetical protein